MAQLVCYQPPVVPLLPGRQEQSLPQQQTSQGQGPSTAAERTSAQSGAEQSSNPPDPQFQSRVMSLLSSMEQRLAAMESKSEGPPPLESWADRSLDGGEVTGGLNDPNLTLPGGRGSTSEDTEEVSETATLVEVSEETAQVVNAAFKTPLANTARQALRRQFGVPKLDTTKCPKLDTVIKCNLSKEVKDADSQLARIHTLVLDAVAPLVQVLEEAASKTLTAESATKAAKTALSLIGNTSCQLAKERRKKVLKELNKDLQPLAEVEGTFAEAAPLLFGNGFEKQMKDHVEALKCLRKSTGRPQNSEQFFRKGRPHNHHTHRGGGTSSFRGRGRYNPYQRRGGKENQKSHWQKPKQ